MKLPSFLRLWLARLAVKASGLTFVPEWVRTSFLVPTFRTLAEEGYRANSIVFACISQLAFSFPAAHLRIWQQDATSASGRTPLLQHPLYQLLTRPPSGQMGMSRLLAFTIVYMAIGGNCYWYKVRSAAKRVVGLLPLHDGQIRPVAAATGLVDHYELDTGANQPQPIAAGEIVHFMWLPDPLHPERGLAPLLAVAREVDTDTEATAYLFALLKNDAIPRIALIAPAEAEVDPEHAERLRTQWQEKYGGANRGGVGVFTGGLEVKQLSLNLQELAFEALRRVPEARIAGAFRTPPVLVGLNVGLEQMTYNNVAGMRRHFTEETLYPLWQQIETQVNASLLPEFGDTGEVFAAFDYAGVPALAEVQQQKRVWAGGALAAGWVTVNEARGLADLSPDPRGDIYLRNLTMLEVPFGKQGGGGAGEQGSKGAGGQVSDEVASGGQGQGSKSTNQRIGESANPDRQEAGGKGKEAAPKAHRRLTRESQSAYIAALRVTRRQVGNRLEAALDKYFDNLGEHVLSRFLEQTGGKGAGEQGGRGAGVETKKLPPAEDLLTVADEAALRQIIQAFYAECLEASWDYYNHILGVSQVFSFEDPVVTGVLKDAASRVKDIQNTTLEALRSLLQQANTEGWSIDHIVRGDPASGVPGLKSLVQETYKGRAETIARTELGTAQNVAAVSRYTLAGVKQVFVMDNGNEDDDEPCQAVNGTVQSLEWALANPLEHPNCVIGSTQVFARDVLAAYFREFHGEVVVLRTAANHTLTCTPNHPILTSHGWVAAGHLQQGDYVVCGDGSEWGARWFNPDDDEMPATIEKVTDALLKARRVATGVVPGAAKDFHGDGAEGDVHIVLTDGFLRNRGVTALGQEIQELALARRDPLLSVGLVKPGPLLKIGEGLAGAAYGIMGSRGYLGSQGWWPVTGREYLRLAEGTQGIATPPKDTAQGTSLHAKNLAQILGAFASYVAAIEVVEVKREWFAGHVYNLSTNAGWYLANGIVTHNCTRAYAPEV